MKFRTRLSKGKVNAMGEQPSHSGRSRPQNGQNHTAFDRWLISCKRDDKRLSIAMVDVGNTYLSQTYVDAKIAVVDRYMIQIEWDGDLFWLNKAYIVAVQEM